MAERGKRDRPRPTLEDLLDSLSPREYRRLLEPLAGIEWRNGRMTMPRSEAEHMALHRTGDFEDLAKDDWRSFLYDKTRRVDWFLRSYMSLHPSRKPGKQRTQEDLRNALFGVLRRHWADRPARLNFVDPVPWLDPASPNPKGHLYKTVARDARKLWVKRAKGREPLFARPGGEEVFAELTHREQVRVEREFTARESALEQGVGERVEREIAEFGLTPREAEVARLAVWGKGSAEIAAELGIAASTVREHRMNIRGKVEHGDAC